VERPNTRVIAADAKNNVGIPRDCDCVSSHRVREVPCCFTFAEYSSSPAYDLELLAYEELALACMIYG